MCVCVFIRLFVCLFSSKKKTDDDHNENVDDDNDDDVCLRLQYAQ